MEHILFKTKHTEWNLLHLKKKKRTQADNDGWANISKENEKKKKKSCAFTGSYFRTAPV